MYGYCPRCGAPAISRERSPNGMTTCEKGHRFPHRETLPNLKVFGELTPLHLKIYDYLKSVFPDLHYVIVYDGGGKLDSTSNVRPEVALKMVEQYVTELREDIVENRSPQNEAN